MNAGDVYLMIRAIREAIPGLVVLSVVGFGLLTVMLLLTR